MATITVPGANHTIISHTYDGAANSALATSMATTLNALFDSGAIAVTSVGGGSVPSSGSEVVLAGGGSFDVPDGYGWVVTNTSAAQTITGGTNLIGGNQSIDYTNPSGATSSVVAGNGNDTFNLSGSYTAAGGSGSDYWALRGTGAVSLGGGVNAVNVFSGADTVFAGTGSPFNLVNVGEGSLVFHAADSASGPGGSATQVDSIYGGAGGSTVYGGANGAISFQDNFPSASGLLIAGAGNETLVGALSHGNDALFSSFTPGTNDELLASTSPYANTALVGGSGTDSLVGGGGHDVFYILNATAHNMAPGTDLIFNANPNDTVALLGFDTLYGAAAGSGGAAKQIGAAFGSASSVTLKDGTTITFAGPTNANGIHFTSS